jgi:hypothetical protein
VGARRHSSDVLVAWIVQGVGRVPAACPRSVVRPPSLGLHCRDLRCLNQDWLRSDFDVCPSPLSHCRHWLHSPHYQLLRGTPFWPPSFEAPLVCNSTHPTTPAEIGEPSITAQIRNFPRPPTCSANEFALARSIVRGL